LLCAGAGGALYGAKSRHRHEIRKEIYPSWVTGRRYPIRGIHPQGASVSQTSAAGQLAAIPSVRRMHLNRLLEKAGLTFLTLFVAAIAAFMLLPFVWTALTSLKTWEEIHRIPITWLPDRLLNFENYRILVTEYPTLRWFGNSVLVSVVAILSSLFFCSLAGYAFAKLRFRGRDFCFIAVLAVLMMPFEVTFLPLMVMFSRMGLVNTYVGIIGPNFMSAIGVFIMRQFMQGVPNDYIDAARVDGASELQIFRHIALPTAGAAFVTVGVLKFILSWNSFLWPLVMAQDESMMTLTVGMQTFVQLHVIDYRLLTAAATLSVVPLLFMFVFAQRWVIDSMVMSGLKG
jgi:multiple sugar transport system permease protein